MSVVSADKNQALPPATTSATVPLSGPVTGALPSVPTTARQESDVDRLETRDWLDSLNDLLVLRGPERAQQMLRELQLHAQRAGLVLPITSQTPYVNTIPVERQPLYPGNRELERKIKAIVRWNAAAMVVRANRKTDDGITGGGVGGHIATFASSATLYEVGFNHFFKGPGTDHTGDMIYFQGHASPGMYSRAFLEGRLSEAKLENFRQELQPGGGLSSYPHPWLMPDFWEFPTVSMGLGPIMAIYHARFLRYMQDRSLKNNTGRKIWAFLGDGECDEPETLGAIGLASREKLDNLIFVVNCNLQRLDGPVRGNGKIIQELEGTFRGAGWNVIKVIWGTDWDPLLAQDTNGILVRRMGEVVDGQYQKYVVAGGRYMRKHFFGGDPFLEKLAERFTDEQIGTLRTGGHDPAKVHAAYQSAVNYTGAPTVILARTIKGYGLGDAGEGRNMAHNAKKMAENQMLYFRDRFQIPISDEEAVKATYYKPPEDSPEIRYLKEHRAALGGPLPKRFVSVPAIAPAEDKIFAEFEKGSAKEVSTTMIFTRLLASMMSDKNIGKYVVPIVPDEMRTFGMEAHIGKYGIYSHVGQLYEPVDKLTGVAVYYKEARDGQILEEGISEAGAIASFKAAGTAYANHGVPTIPFYIYYSMFGFQRVGDQIWCAGDMRSRGFLIGATAGRTTLNGEGLQHQDGHSHLLALPVPNLVAYDPAYGYEIATIIQDGLKRMYAQHENIFYYVTIHNENYLQPALPTHLPSEILRAGILKGIYQFSPAPFLGTPAGYAQLLGSGSIMNETVKAQKILAEKFNIAAAVWSVTSYKELRRDALECERWNQLHPDQPAHIPHIQNVMSRQLGVAVASSDNMKALPDLLSRFMPLPYATLGTEGFGRSETRAALRDFFEVDARYIALAALNLLAKNGQLDPAVPARAVAELGLNPEKLNPLQA